MNFLILANSCENYLWVILTNITHIYVSKILSLDSSLDIQLETKEVYKIVQEVCKKRHIIKKYICIYREPQRLDDATEQKKYLFMFGDFQFFLFSLS